MFDVFILLTISRHCIGFAAYEFNKNPRPKPLFDDGSYRPHEYGNTGAYYEYGYNVNAIETGDMKRHTEIRSNDQVRGAYLIVEPNGVSRFVQYLANCDGFKAIVRQKYRPTYLVQENYTPTIRARQGLHTSILSRKSDESDNARLSTPQKVAFEKLLKQAQLIKGSPTSIVIPNRSSQKSQRWHYLQTPNFKQNKLEATEFRILKVAEPDRQQYAVVEPIEVDFDVRRSIRNSIASNEREQ